MKDVYYLDSLFNIVGEEDAKYKVEVEFKDGKLVEEKWVNLNKKKKQEIKDDLRERIVKRYKLIVDEYNSRNLRWLWSKHILDKLIKADWCSEAGGKWITHEGKHICISEEKEVKAGIFERTLIGRENKAKLVYDVGRRETANKATSWYNSLSDKHKSKITEININRERKTIKEFYEGEIPKGYELYEDRIVGGSWDYSKGKISVFKDGASKELAHEFGHAIYSSGEVRGYHQVWKEEKVSSYSEVSAPEGFAEAYRYYKTKPSVLRRKHPKTSKFMEDLFEGEK